MASSPYSAGGRVLALRQQLAMNPSTTSAPVAISGNSADVVDTARNIATRVSRANEESDALMEELTREADTELAAPPAGGLIDVRIRELEREQGWVGVMNNLGLERRADGKLADGDTLVVMKFPDAVAQWPPAPRFVRCDGSQWRSVKFRVHSNKLRHMGSNVFSEMFLPKQQARILRRLRLTVDELPNGIDFVLDLTPPSEGDESASLLAMLSLPLSVRTWWQSWDRLGVSGTLVSGHDDSCPEHQSVPVNCMRKGSGIGAGQPKAQNPRTQSGILYPDDIMPCPERDIPDYCPIRHRASILRLLESIECGGHELHLDSAPRVFTMAKIAKFFECTAAVRDHICSWLMHGVNSLFIELHPEAALSISWDLQLRDPTRVAFRVRVVEDAIELVDSRPVCAVQKLSNKTIFGRSREPLSDELDTAIEHGRVRLIERVRHTADSLLSPSHDPLGVVFGRYSHLGSSQWQLLVAIGKMLGCNIAGHRDHSAHATIDLSYVSLQVVHAARDALEALVLALGTFVRAAVSYALEPPDPNGPIDPFEFREADLDREWYYARWPSFTDTKFLYRKLSRYQRLLTSHPWERLKNRVAGPRYRHHFSDEWIIIFNRIKRLNQCLAPLAYNLPVGYVRFDTAGDFNVFNDDAFEYELGTALTHVADTWIGLYELEIPPVRTSFLALGLFPDELEYLPLWAGGNNDETWGIFNEHAVPDADMGPIQPGPSYHTGCSVPSMVSSIAQSTPTASADSKGDDTMTAGMSIKAIPTTRAASSARPLNDNESTVALTLDPAARGAMADDTTDRTSPEGDDSETERGDDFDSTVTCGDSDEDWALDDGSD